MDCFKLGVPHKHKPEAQSLARHKTCRQFDLVAGRSTSFKYLEPLYQTTYKYIENMHAAAFTIDTIASWLWCVFVTC